MLHKTLLLLYAYKGSSSRVGGADAACPDTCELQGRAGRIWFVARGYRLLHEWRKTNVPVKWVRYGLDIRLRWKRMYTLILVDQRRITLPYEIVLLLALYKCTNIETFPF